MAKPRRRRSRVGHSVVGRETRVDRTAFLSCVPAGTRAFPTPDRGGRLILMAARFPHKGVTFVYWRC
jgi:hypothetical protein